MAIEQWGFFSLLHPLWHGPTLFNGHLRMTIRDTHTCCRAFGRGTVTTCFNELDTSRPRVEPRSSACEANVLPLRHRGGPQWTWVPRKGKDLQPFTAWLWRRLRMSEKFSSGTKNPNTKKNKTAYMVMSNWNDYALLFWYIDCERNSLCEIMIESCDLPFKINISFICQYSTFKVPERHCIYMINIQCLLLF